MFKKKTTPAEPQSVSTLNHNIANSFFSKSKIKAFRFVGLIKKFYRDYRLPSVATTIFLVLLLSLAIVRQLEKTSLIGLRNEVAGDGNGYSILLSADEADQFKRDNSTDDPGGNSASDGSNSFTSSSTNDNDGDDAPGGSDGDGGSNGGGGGTGGGGGDPIPAPPFTAAISSIVRGSTLLECTNPSRPNKGSCTKVYTFTGDVQTLNGPGTVNYSWQSSIDGGDGSGGFLADAASDVTTVSKEVRLICTKNSNFNIQLVLSSPNSSNSNIISVAHNCNEL